ncbi:hypothetical protein TNCV_1343551 [Trichonephila clavipes]|nr:hypothetical protein TNCV_1343551 [Trichonephila clavipes]
MYLPPNVTALLELMDQGAIENLQRIIYRKQVLKRLLLAEKDEESVAAFAEKLNMKDARYMRLSIVQSISGIQECDEDLVTWRAYETEDYGFQTLNDDEIVTSVQESDFVDDEDEDNNNDKSSKGSSNADVFCIRQSYRVVRTTIRVLSYSGTAAQVNQILQ